jgi:hypothetical protein
MKTPPPRSRLCAAFTGKRFRVSQRRKNLKSRQIILVFSTKIHFVLALFSIDCGYTSQQGEGA